ncbi:MAG: ribonuclease HI family protein [Methanocellales archaeon]
MKIYIKIYIDGGVKGHQFKNKRTGFIALVLNSEEIVEEVGAVTNNQAEYLALIKALEIAIQRKIPRVEVLSDSELLIKQMKNLYKVRSENLIPLHKKARELILKLDSFKMTWIPREQNLAGRVLSRKIS